MTQKMKEYIEGSETLLYSCTCRENSKMCKEAKKLIGRKDTKNLEEIINSEDFDPNERFDSAYVAGENYINYALNNSSYEAARILANKHTIILSPNDKERLLLELISKRKFRLLYNLIGTIEKQRINILRFVKGIIKQDYESIIKGPIKSLRSNA